MNNQAIESVQDDMEIIKQQLTLLIGDSMNGLDGKKEEKTKTIGDFQNAEESGADKM